LRSPGARQARIACFTRGIKASGYILLFLLLASSCNFEKYKSVTTTGETTIGIDESVSPLMKKEGEEFMRLNKESRINEIVKTSNELIADIVNGDLKTVVVTRDFNQQENDLISKFKIEVKKYVFARDGVGIIVNPANPVRKLKYVEIRKIFLSEITDWKDLEKGGEFSGRIRPFIARKNAALHDYLRNTVLGGQEFGKSCVVCTTSAQMIDEVRADKNAIGFISMSWITRFADTLDTTVKPLKISDGVKDYVGLHQAYIADGSYPLVMDIYIFSTDPNMNVSAGFIEFLLSYDGQKIVLNSGLVPTTQPVRIIELK